MPDNPLNNINPEDASEAAQNAIDAAQAAAQNTGGALQNEADDAFSQLADALGGGSQPAVDATVAEQPFSTPNGQVQPFANAGGIPTFPQAQPGVQPEAQPVYDPAVAAPMAQPAIDPNQQAYVQQTAQPGTYDPNRAYQQAYNDAYQQAQYGAQPTIPQYTQTGSDPGTTPMVLGICSIVGGIFLALVGLVLGIIAIVKARPVQAAYPTNSRAKAGKITGIVGIVISVLNMLFGVLLGWALIAGISNSIDDEDLDYLYEELESLENSQRPRDWDSTFFIEANIDGKPCYVYSSIV